MTNRIKKIRRCGYLDWFLYENQCTEQGYSNICGVDEAGRGPLAGPVCAAAVILKTNDII